MVPPPKALQKQYLGPPLLISVAWDNCVLCVKVNDYIFSRPRVKLDRHFNTSGTGFNFYRLFNDTFVLKSCSFEVFPQSKKKCLSISVSIQNKTILFFPSENKLNLSENLEDVQK